MVKLLHPKQSRFWRDEIREKRMTHINTLNTVFTQNLNGNQKTKTNTDLTAPENVPTTLPNLTDNESNVALTEQAKKIKQLHVAINDTINDVNLELVEITKQQIAKGEYKINFDKMASQLLDFDK